MTIRQFLVQSGLLSYVEVFESQHVSVSDLVGLTDEELITDFGMKPYGDRRRLKLAVAALASAPSLSGVYVYENGAGTFEGNDVFANKTVGFVVTTGGAPTVRNNRIHDGPNAGVYVYENGAGTFESNDIFGNKGSGVAVRTGGTPMVRNNRIHDGLNAGVYVLEKGAGSFEGNNVFANTLAGFAVTNGGAPTVRNNRIHDGLDCGVHVYENGAGTFEGNTLFGNKKAGIAMTKDGRGRFSGNTLTGSTPPWSVDCGTCSSTGLAGLFVMVECKECVGGGRVLRHNNSPPR
jgi:parallel beta-helix repeat protein